MDVFDNNQMRWASFPLLHNIPHGMGGEVEMGAVVP